MTDFARIQRMIDEAVEQRVEKIVEERINEFKNNLSLSFGFEDDNYLTVKLLHDDEAIASDYVWMPPKNHDC